MHVGQAFDAQIPRCGGAGHRGSREPLSLHDEVELAIGDDEPLIATVVETGLEIRDRYRVGITCDRR